MAITVYSLSPERIKDGAISEKDLCRVEISGDDEAKILEEMAAYTIIKSERTSLSHEDMGDFDGDAQLDETPFLEIPCECIISDGKLVGAFYNNVFFFTDGTEPLGDGVSSSAVSENGRSTYRYNTNYSLKREHDVTYYQGVVYRSQNGNPYHTALFSPSYVKSIELHPDTELIPNHAFYSHKSLESITVPDSVKRIGIGAFRNCAHLGHVRLGTGIEAISDNLFRDCVTLGRIDIPEGTRFIDENAFFNCKSLKTVSIPSSMKCVYAQNFYECTSLVEIIAESAPRITYYSSDYSAEEWGVKIHSGESLVIVEGDFEFYIGDDVPRLVSYCGKEKTVTLPENFRGKEYLLGKYAFQYSGVTSITVPQGIKLIPEFAFSGSKELETVSLPCGITEIQTCAFSGCERLKSVNFPEGLREIGDRAFSNCTSLTSVSFPGSVISLGESLFSGCHSLCKVELAEGLKKISAACFFGCCELHSIVIPKSVSEIGDSAFKSCTGLSEIIFLGEDTQIERSAFESCMSLEEIPRGVKTIPQYVFYNCIKMRVANIPEGVKEIGYGAFRDCERLETVTVPDSVCKISQEVFKNCASLREVIFANPDGWPSEFQSPRAAAEYLKENMYYVTEKK